MKIIMKLTFAALAALVVTVLFQTPITRAGDDSDRHDDRRTLHLIPVFTSFHTTAAKPDLPAVGDQLTFGGTLARPNRPDKQIGTVGTHFVVTAPEGAEWLGNGCLILPDGKISFQRLLGANDWAGDLHAVITGGTGTYRNAAGEFIHHCRADGGEEFIFNFSN